MPIFRISYDVNMFIHIKAATAEEAKQKIENAENLNWKGGTVSNIEVYNITEENPK